MKKLRTHCYLMLALAGCLFSSCDDAKTDGPGGGGHFDRVPSNVRLSELTSNSITVAWDRVEGATSYTAQLLDSKDSDVPIDAYTTVSKDFHKFDRLSDVGSYYVRVRANKDFDTGDWVRLMNGTEPARIIPAYGIVSEDFKVPELYPNFPETFEVHPDPDNRKRAYAGDRDVFPSGEWLMTNVYTHNPASLIHKVGTWAALLRNDVACYLTMNFDLPNGATKVSFITGAATITNALELDGMPIVMTLEYSVDQGATWTKVGNDILIDDLQKQYQLSFNMDIKQPVRFRFGKNASKARPILDNIAVYY